MKKSLLLPFALFPCFTSFAQVCTNPQSSIDLHGNRISARILNGGDLFTNLVEGKFILDPQVDVARPSTIYAAGLWLGGIDTSRNFRVAATTYRTNSQHDFFSGPLSEDGTTDDTNCSLWDRHFLVRGSEITAFLAALPALSNNPTQAIEQFPDVMGWPGRGNPFFSTVWGFSVPFNNIILAPFVDTNQDGLYDPLQGDYPAVILRGHQPFVADEMVWCVFNDQGGEAFHSESGGGTFPVEVQLTAWAFDAPDESILSKTVFTSHKLIFRTNQKIDSCFVGIWADFDIGCSKDDFVGTAPESNSIFAYNQDAIDGQSGNTCEGAPVFEGTAPVQSATFLNVSLDKSIANSAFEINGNTTAAHYYDFLAGRWPDGTPLTYGGYGYLSGGDLTDYIFPDDPSDPEGWSQCTLMPAPHDRVMVASHRIGEVLPGQVEELTIGWAIHTDPLLPCGLGSTFQNIATLQNLFDNNFNGGLLEAPVVPLPESALTLQPNPATTKVILQYGKMEVLELQCFDVAGRLIGTVKNLPKEQYELNVSGWHSGVYHLRLLTAAGIVTRQLVVGR